jgi:hypothetical protein
MEMPHTMQNFQCLLRTGEVCEDASAPIQQCGFIFVAGNEIAADRRKRSGWTPFHPYTTIVIVIYDYILFTP